MSNDDSIFSTKYLIWVRDEVKLTHVYPIFHKIDADLVVISTFDERKTVVKKLHLKRVWQKGLSLSGAVRGGCLHLTPLNTEFLFDDVVRDDSVGQDKYVVVVGCTLPGCVVPNEKICRELNKCGEMLGGSHKVISSKSNYTAIPSVLHNHLCIWNVLMFSPEKRIDGENVDRFVMPRIRRMMVNLFPTSKKNIDVILLHPDKEWVEGWRDKLKIS